MDSGALRGRALIVIDMQRGLFEAAPAGSFVREREATIIENTRRLAEATRRVGGAVVMVKVARPAVGGKPLVVDDPLAVGSAGAEFVDALRPGPTDLVVAKVRVSAFYETQLDALLRWAGITSVVVTGIFTNVGVESTVRDAWDRFYDVTVAEDACATPKREGHVAAIELSLPRFAAIASTNELLNRMTEVR